MSPVGELGELGPPGKERISEEFGDGIGWKWRIRWHPQRGLILERFQIGRRLFWQWVVDLAGYSPAPKGQEMGVNQFRTETYAWMGILVSVGVYVVIMLLLVAAVEGWLVR